MRHRIEFRSPEYGHLIDVRNGRITQTLTLWTFFPESRARHQLQNFDTAFAAHPRMSEVLRLCGIGATLWIGDWQGTILPPDPPQAWTYPNGAPLEPEWEWDWHPCERSEKEIVERLNERLETWSIASDSPLKVGVPVQLQSTFGELQAVTAIPIRKLPNLVKKDTAWIFEFEKIA